MLPKSKRLNLKTHFKKIASGERTESSSFNIFSLIEGQDLPLVGISLSKKYFQGAVERNKARRLVSRAIEVLYPNLPKGLNLIIMPKTKVLSASIDEIVGELKNVKILNITD